MTSSPFDGHSRAPLRIGLALIAGFIFLSEAAVTFEQARDDFFRPLPWGGVVDGPLFPLALGALFAVGSAGLWLVARGKRAVLGGLVALGCMAPVAHVGEYVFGSISHNFFFPAAMLLGWVAGLLYARWLTRRTGVAFDRDQEERFAEAGAVGVLAALYVGSALSKLWTSGFAWVDPYGLRAVLIAQDGLARVAWIDAYRTLIIEHPALSQAAMVATLIVEGGGFLLLANRSVRFVWGLLLLGLHVNIMVLAGIPYIEPMMLLPLFTVPWPALLRRRPDPSRGVTPATPPGGWPEPWGLLALAYAVFVVSLFLPESDRGRDRNEERGRGAPPAASTSDGR